MTANRPVLFLSLPLLVLSACNRRADYYISRGDRLLRESKFKEAAIEYKKAIQKDPNSGEAYFQLSDALFQQGDAAGGYRALTLAVKYMPASQEAKAKLADFSLAAYIANPQRNKPLYDKTSELSRQLLAQDSRSYDGLRLKGAIALLDQKPKEAIDDFRQASSIRLGEPKAILGLSQALFQDNQPAEGERIALDLIQKQAYGPAFDFLYGHYVQQKRWADAENLLKAKLSHNPKDAATVFELAGHYAALQKAAEVTATLQKLLDAPKDFPDARLQIGDFYASRGNWPEALRYFQEGANAGGSNNVIYQKRAIGALVSLSRRDEAIQLAEEIVKGQPKDEDALRIRASLWLGRGKPEDLEPAIHDLTAISAKHPDDAQLHLILGQAYRRKGDATEARKQFEAIKTNSRDTAIESRLELAEIAFRLEPMDSALHYAEQALSEDSTNPKARLYRAVALTGLGRLDEARGALDSLLRDRPNYAEARLQMAVLNIAEKKYSQAQDTLAKLERANPGDIRPVMGMAESYGLQSQFDKALAVLGEEIKKSPTHADLRLLMGTMAARAGKFELAIEQYSKLAAQDPKSAEWRMRLGDVYQMKGDLPAAAAQFEQAKQLAPSAASPSILLAGSLERSGRPEEAKASYRRALQLQPDNPIVMNNLAMLLANSGGNLDEALELAKKALQKAPNEAPILDTLGWVYLKKNSVDSALQTFTSLSKKYPDVPMFRYHLGLAAIQKGDRFMARNELEQALASKPSAQEAAEVRDALAKLNQ